MNKISEDRRNQLGFLYLTFAVVLLTMLTSRTEAEVLERDCHINNFIPKVVCLEMEQPLNQGDSSGQTITVGATHIPGLEHNKSNTTLLVFTGGGPRPSRKRHGTFSEGSLFRNPQRARHLVD